MDDDYLEKKLARSQVERDEDWEEWCNKAPWLQFPPGLDVKIIPPVHGAMVRFMVRFADGTDADNTVSVYWDCHNALGIMSKPYWEIYPVKYKGDDGDDYEDTARYLEGEESQMMVSIIKALMGEYE